MWTAISREVVFSPLLLALRHRRMLFYRQADMPDGEMGGKEVFPRPLGPFSSPLSYPVFCTRPTALFRRSRHPESRGIMEMNRVDEQAASRNQDRIFSSFLGCRAPLMTGMGTPLGAW